MLYTSQRGHVPAECTIHPVSGHNMKVNRPTIWQSSYTHSFNLVKRDTVVMHPECLGAQRWTECWLWPGFSRYASNQAEKKGKGTKGLIRRMCVSDAGDISVCSFCKRLIIYKISAPKKVPPIDRPVSPYAIQQKYIAHTMTQCRNEYLYALPDSQCT